MGNTDQQNCGIGGRESRRSGAVTRPPERPWPALWHENKQTAYILVVLVLGALWYFTQSRSGGGSSKDSDDAPAPPPSE